MTAKEIQREIKALEDQMAPLVERESALRDLLLKTISPIQVNDRITWDASGNRPNVGMVLKLGWWLDEVQYEVYPILKDGSVSSHSVMVYPYCHPRKA